MRRFDPSRPSHPVLRLATVCNLRLTGPEIPAFRAFDFVSGLPISQSRERNCRKSPALSAEIPVLQRFSAETGSITTAARGPQYQPSSKGKRQRSPLPPAHRAACQTNFPLIGGPIFEHAHTTWTSKSKRRMSASGGKADSMCSERVFPGLTPSRHLGGCPRYHTVIGHAKFSGFPHDVGCSRCNHRPWVQTSPVPP